MLGASIGAIGTALAQRHLRNVLAYHAFEEVPELAVVHYVGGINIYISSVHIVNERNRQEADDTSQSNSSGDTIRGRLDRDIALVPCDISRSVLPSNDLTITPVAMPPRKNAPQYSNSSTASNQIWTRLSGADYNSSDFTH